MPDNVVQFVPKPRSARPTLLEGQEIKAAEFLSHAPALVVGDTAPCEYVAPDSA